MKSSRVLVCYTLWGLLIFVFPIMLFGCQQALTTQPSESSSFDHQSDTNAVTYKTLCEMLDEAQESLNSQQKLKIPSNYYTDMFVERQRLVEAGVISKNEGNYVVDASMLGEYTDKVRYLVFLSFLLERYPDYLEFTYFDLDAETLAQKEKENSISFRILLFMDYKKAGFENIREYMSSDTDIPQGSVEFYISFSLPDVSMTYMEGEYTLRYRVYSTASPCLYYGTATEPYGIHGPTYPGYTGDGKPPC